MGTAAKGLHGAGGQWPQQPGQGGTPGADLAWVAALVQKEELGWPGMPFALSFPCQSRREGRAPSCIRDLAPSLPLAR